MTDQSDQSDEAELSTLNALRALTYSLMGKALTFFAGVICLVNGLGVRNRLHIITGEGTIVFVLTFI